MFRNRMDAGRKLARRLAPYKGKHDVVVLGIPRGGVVVAAEVADALHAPLDVIVVRKIGAPGMPEFAAGAIDEQGRVLRNPAAEVSERYLESEAQRLREDIARRLESFREGRPELDLSGRTAILVDDGIATGLTVRKAVGLAKAKRAAKVVLAVPVASRQASEQLAREVDEMVVLEVPDWFMAVGQFYQVFGQVGDGEVKTLLAEHAHDRA